MAVKIEERERRKKRREEKRKEKKKEKERNLLAFESGQLALIHGILRKAI